MRPMLPRMLASNWIKSAARMGWVPLAVSGAQIKLGCDKHGCTKSMTLPLENLGPVPDRCAGPHKNGYGIALHASYESLVDQFRQRRCVLGMSQADVNAAMGMADGYVGKLESFMKIARPPTLLLWAETIGLALTTSPAPLPAATLRAIDQRKGSPYAASQARFKHG